MAEIISERAKRFLASPRFYKTEKTTGMRKYPGHPDLWIEIEWDQKTVKNLSFTGQMADEEKVLIESMANLLVGKKIDLLSTLSARECEAFLRDKNSVLAIQGMTEKSEKDFRSLLMWIHHWPQKVEAQNYTFSSEKGPFSRLSLVDKVREVKAFLISPEILSLYEKYPRPELIDVEGLTVYIDAPYESQEEKSLFEELHLLGVAAFQEENLNFIPEA